LRRRADYFLGLSGSEYKPCVGNVNFDDFAAFELFGYAEDVLDCHIVAFNFGVDNILKLDFAV
jgi:hypothetical protein